MHMFISIDYYCASTSSEKFLFVVELINIKKNYNWSKFWEIAAVES